MVYAFAECLTSDIGPFSLDKTLIGSFPGIR